MKKTKLLLIALSIIVLAASCKKDNEVSPSTPTTTEHNYYDNPFQRKAGVYAGFPETFEAGSKTAYAAANVTLSTGSWNLDNALIGTSTSDHKTGSKSVRITSTGIVTMNFNLTDGATQVSISHAVYGTDGSSTWELYYSTNSGSTWTKTGSTITTSSTSLNTATFTMSVSGNVRFQLRKISGGSNRINIDNFSVTDNGSGGGGGGGTPTRDDNMGMGNPSGATTSTSNSNNYLMNKTQYSLSYNNSKGTPNWVSWHLSSAWLGSTARCDCFTADNTLPAGYFKATTSNYTGSGFDRGHMCPSADRNGSSSDNAATFLMTNIVPQAPYLNQNPWADLEDYCRTLTSQGYEMYIVSGVYGQGGTGSNGSANTLASGSITVPSHTWKVIVVLPVGSSDVSRVSTSTRVIAVDMPNTQSVGSAWGNYRTTVNAIESATGYDFLNNVSTTIQSTIEAQVDGGPTS